MIGYLLLVALIVPPEPTSAQERAIDPVPDRAPPREAPREARAPAGEPAEPRPPGQNEQDPITVTGERRTDADRRREEDRRVVCQRGVRTGSVMPTTTCKTVAEWREIRERSVRELDRLRADRRSRDHTNAVRGESN
jgi:hypothetical protein